MTLRPGDYFGEMALLHNLPRAATCIAECEEDEVVKCVSMRRSHFESLFGNLKDMMERQVKRRILKSLVIFEAVSDAAIDVAAEKMRVAEYARGDSIVVEGEEGNKLFIIQKGRVKVTKATFNDRDEVSGQTQLGILEDNACFGEKSLVESGPRNATVTALSEAVVCYWLGRREYELCIENQEAPDEDVAEADAAQSAPEAPRFVVSDPSKLKIASLLGQGGFGRVLLVEHKHPHKLMALKAMSKKAVTDAKQEKTLLAERDCIKKFDHAFVVGFYGAFQDRDFVYLAIEYAAGGDLYSFMYEREEQSRRFRGPLGGLDARTSRFYLGCIALGLEHLHGHHVAWRDLKPENILFDPQGYVKLSDFGFAKEFVHEDHDGGEPSRTRIFDPTSMGAYATREFLRCFETSVRAIDSSKHQPNRRRCDREARRLDGTSQAGGRFRRRRRGRADVHALRHARLPRAGDRAEPGPRQGRRLLGAGRFSLRALLRADAVRARQPGRALPEHPPGVDARPRGRHVAGALPGRRPVPRDGAPPHAAVLPARQRRERLRVDQGSKRERNSQLQRLLSRPCSTRFG